MAFKALQSTSARPVSSTAAVDQLGTAKSDLAAVMATRQSRRMDAFSGYIASLRLDLTAALLLTGCVKLMFLDDASASDITSLAKEHSDAITHIHENNYDIKELNEIASIIKYDFLKFSKIHAEDEVVSVIHGELSRYNETISISQFYTARSSYTVEMGRRESIKAITAQMIASGIGEVRAGAQAPAAAQRGVASTAGPLSPGAAAAMGQTPMEEHTGTTTRAVVTTGTWTDGQVGEADAALEAAVTARGQTRLDRASELGLTRIREDLSREAETAAPGRREVLSMAIARVDRHQAERVEAARRPAVAHEQTLTRGMGRGR